MRLKSFFCATHVYRDSESFLWSAPKAALPSACLSNVEQRILAAEINVVSPVPLWLCLSSLQEAKNLNPIRLGRSSGSLARTAGEQWLTSVAWLVCGRLKECSKDLAFRVACWLSDVIGNSWGEDGAIAPPRDVWRKF